MYLFKLLLKDFRRLWQTKEGKEFLKLAWKYGDYPRNTPAKVNFLDYQFDVPDAFSFMWEFHDTFVEEEYTLKITQDIPVIYDCGAYVGTHCLYFKQQYPKAKIKAFEADPAISALLTTNLHRHNITDIEIINKAIWTHNEGINSLQNRAQGSSEDEQNKEAKVPSVKLADLLKKESSIDLLRMDLKGLEVSVLKDCKDGMHHVRNIFVRYQSFIGQPQQLEVIAETLKAAGFRYYIKNKRERKQPFISHLNETHSLDLQLDIFGCRE